MAKQVNKTVIGGFVVSAIALLVAGVIVLGGGEMFKKKINYVMFFENSIKGLNVGAPVVWNGVRIGKVSQIIVDYDEKELDFNIPVIIELDPSLVRSNSEPITDIQERRRIFQEWIDKGLRAQLTLQSIVTGQLMIELDFRPDSPVHLSGVKSEYLEIPTTTSGMEALGNKLKNLPVDKIANELLDLLTTLQQWADGPMIKDTFDNIHSASQHLNQLMANANTLVTDADVRVKTVLDSFAVTSDDAQKFLVDARKLVKNSDRQVQSVSNKIQDAIASTKGAMDQAKTTLEEIDGFVGDDSNTRNKLDRALEEIASAAQSMNSLMDYLERHPESLLKGK